MISRPVFITLLIALNTVPLYGVFQWGWKSFDLIFLYWIENLIIGFFMILRILIRRYSHPIELIMPLFLVPFFTLHYGIFCLVHGSIIINLFGKGLPGEFAGMDIPEIILPFIQSQHLFWPIVALFIYQLVDWLRDSNERGLGRDGIKELTTAPYHRIMVLHVTIIASGFALGTLNEPLSGILLLIAFKTGIDIYHSNKAEKVAITTESNALDKKTKNKIKSFLDNPVIKVNGKEIRYNSFEELKTSKYYTLMQTMMRILGNANKMQEIESYIEQQTRKRNELP